MYKIIEKVMKELGFKISKTQTAQNEQEIETSEMKVILNEQQPEINEFKEYNFFAEKSSKAIYYFCDFYDYKKDSNIKENIIAKQKKYYEYMMKKEDNNVLQKNTTLIIFIEVEDEKLIRNLKDMTLEFEEDKYFFRKLVLIYTKKELELLRSSMPEDDLLKYINNEIRKNELFNEFKKGAKENSYSLLLRMIVKVPVLNYHIEKSIELSSLNDIIKNELIDNNLNVIVDKVLSLNLKGSKKQSDSVIDEFINELIG